MKSKKIVFQTLRLKDQPEIGQLEPMLKGRKIQFRYLLHQSYKLIYWINIDQNQIEIMDVFDTHQFPEKIKRTK